MKPFDRTLVVLSGGQDSTTCLFNAMRDSHEVMAISFDYGQRHALELAAARTVYSIAEGYAGAYDCALLSHEVLQVGPVLQGTSPLVDKHAPVEQYANADVLPGGIEKTFVPMRNALFIVLAYNRAAVHGCDAIVLGVSEADYGGYPDCRLEFILRMQNACSYALGEAVDKQVELLRPLITLNKRETVLLAQSMPGCMEALAWSHTCYVGTFPPCGTCHACLLRARGFAEAGADDPLVLRASEVQS